MASNFKLTMPIQSRAEQLALQGMGEEGKRERGKERGKRKGKGEVGSGKRKEKGELEGGTGMEKGRISRGKGKRNTNYQNAEVHNSFKTCHIL